MYWRAGTAFDCNFSAWFLDKDLHIHYLTPVERAKWPYTLKTIYHDDKLPMSAEAISEYRARLTRNAFVFISLLRSKPIWNNTRSQWTAACLAVAEVTEEISFLFNAYLKESMELLECAIRFACDDDGVLYKLCVIH